MPATYTAAQKTALLKAPQSGFFTKKRIDQWFEAVLRVDRARAAWHIKRTYGFGGSEIGVLVAERHGLLDPFESARGVVAAKLLLQTPQEPIPAMERGQYMEPVIQQLFMAKMRKHAAVRDERSMRLMSKALGLRPWQVGSPDDVVFIGRGKKKKRYIVDYKAPGDGGYEITGVPMRYAAQLHHYGMIAERLGIEVDGYLLVCVNYQTWNLEVLNVDYDPKLAQAILEVGDFYWDEYVMQDRLPDYGRLNHFDKNNLPEIEELEEQALTYFARKRLADMAMDGAQNARLRMTKMLRRYRLGGAKLPLFAGLLEISGKPDFDVDLAVEALGDGAEEARLPLWDVPALVKAAKGAGVEVERFELIGDKFDPDILRRLLKQQRLDVKVYDKESLTFSLPRAKTGPVADKLVYVSDIASEMIGATASEFEQKLLALPIRPKADQS